MENIRYNSETAVNILKKIHKILDGEDKDILVDYLEKSELELKILLRKIKLKLKKGKADSEQKNMILEYREDIKSYMDILEDINLFLEDQIDENELEEKIESLKKINEKLIETDLKLQKFVVSPKDVTTTLPGREELPPPKKDAKLSRPKIKPKEIDELHGYSSLEILKITAPPRPRKKLPEKQYKRLEEKLNSIGVSLTNEELKKIAECGFDQRINMSVLNRIFDTLEEVISSYGENFKERMKTLLLFIASNYLFIYDVSKFHINFEDSRIEIMEKVIPTLNTGLSITEYLSALMKVIEILQIEESELMGDAKITEDLRLPYVEWIKINEYEINLRYEIRDYWQKWFAKLEIREEFEEDDYEMVDEEAEIFLEKLNFLELKIERLPHALESPWELSSWLKDLFTIMKEHSLEQQQYNKIKRVELIMGTLNFSEQTFVDPNLYTTIRGENLLLKLGRRIEFIKDKILLSLRDTIDVMNNSWQNYRFSQPVDYFDTSVLERGLIGLTLAQTAIDQIDTFFQNKNMLDLVFATQLLSIANELYTIGLTRRPLLLENNKVKNFIYSFINFHTGQLSQEDFLKSTEWLLDTIKVLVQKRDLIKRHKEGNPNISIVEAFIHKILEDYTQGQSDLEMYKQTQLRLFLLTSIYSVIQGTNRLIILKGLQDKYFPDDEYYVYFNIISGMLDNF